MDTYKCYVPTLTWDPRNGAVTASQGYMPTMYSFVLHTTAYNYDLAGRRSGNTYDALNRLLEVGTTYGIGYAYGPGSLPMNRSTYTYHSSLGTTPIYATDSSNNVLDVKMGVNDDILPTSPTFTGLTTYDRDPFGYAAAARNSTGTSTWSFANLFSGCATSGNLGGATGGFTGTSMTSCSPSGLQFAYRTDGYFDGTMTFRGVRTYASDTQQWATPDMYQGMASDPLSQMGYNYAGNNPAMFADPSGFDFVWVTPDDGCPSGFTQTGVNSDGSLMCDNGQQSNLPIIASLTTGALGCRITCGDLSGGHSEIVPGAGGHWQVTPCERGGAGLFKCGGKTVSVMASPGCVLGGAASGVATGSGLVSLSKGATAYATFSAARQGGSALLESALAGGKAFLPSTPMGWIGLGISAGIGGIIGGTRAAATGCGVPAWGG